jgi:hypothetical protein
VHHITLRRGGLRGRGRKLNGQEVSRCLHGVVHRFRTRVTKEAVAA